MLNSGLLKDLCLRCTNNKQEFMSFLQNECEKYFNTEMTVRVHGILNDLHPTRWFGPYDEVVNMENFYNVLEISLLNEIKIL